MNVMDLVAKISLDSNEYEKGVSDAKSSFSGLGSAIASGGKTIMKAGVAAFTAIGTAIGGATTALISNAKETAAYADNIDKMSQKMGFTTDAFQEWDFIMQHSGSSIEAVKGSIVKLDKALESDTDAWEKLGLSQEQLLSMSPEQQFEATVAALQNVSSEEEKSALAADIFGKSYQELMPLLNSTNEDVAQMKQQVHDLGGVMSEDAVKAGAQFQDSLQNLKTALNGAKNNLMGEFLPSLSTVMDGLSALFSGDESGIGQIKQGIEDFAAKLNEKLPTVIQTVGSILTSVISALPQAFEAIAGQLPSILEQAIPVLINAVVALADSIVKSLPQLMQAIQSNIGTITSGLSKIISSIGQIILKLTPTILPMLLKVGVQLVTELAKGFSQNASEVIRTIFELINIIVQELTNPETLMQLLECGLQILMAIVNGIAENLPLIMETMFTLIGNIITFLVEAIPQIVTSIGQNGAKIITDVLPQIILKLSEKMSELLGKAIEFLGGWIPDILSKAKEVFESIGQGVLDAMSWIKEKIDGLAEDILGWIGDGLGDVFSIGSDLVHGLWDGITSVADWIKEKITGFGSGITGWLKDTLGISSPSKVTKYFGQMLDAGLVEGVETDASKTFGAIQGVMDDGMDSITLDPLEMNANAAISVKGSSKTRTESKIDQLLDLMGQIVNNREEISIPVFVGGREIDEVFVDSKSRVTVRSGGQVSV